MERFDPERSHFISFLVAVVDSEARAHNRTEMARRRRNERWQHGYHRTRTDGRDINDSVADRDLLLHVRQRACETWARRPKVAPAAELRLDGHSTTAIAAEINVDSRTVRRYTEFDSKPSVRRYLQGGQ